MDSDGFPFVFVTFPGQLFLPFLFDPNRDPYGISERSGLETTREDTAHRFGGLTLGGRGHVGVGVQGEACAEVPQHPGYRFHVHPVLQGQGGKGMPLRYNYDKPEKPRISRVFGYLARFFILFQTEKSSREVVIS